MKVALTPHLRPVQNLIEGVWKVAVHVIASEAKQSVAGKEIASAPTAPRNDTSSPFSKHPRDVSRLSIRFRLLLAHHDLNLIKRRQATTPDMAVPAFKLT